MEAVGVCSPVIANHSMGIAEFFAECDYPVPLLDGLEPGTWARAVCSLSEVMQDPAFQQRLRRSRELLARARGILPDGGDWAQILRETQAAHNARRANPSANPVSTIEAAV
jgi:hypothetical protein